SRPVRAAKDRRSSPRACSQPNAGLGLHHMPRRCEWAEGGDPLNVAYHDEEWGVPSHDDRHHFELLTLEGAQAGLSWITILRKRDGYRSAFEQFDPARVAGFSRRKIED